MHLTKVFESIGPKGPVTLRNFYSNLQRNTVALQVAEELRGVTAYLGNLQRIFFLLRATLHEVESSSTFRNNRSNLQLPLHSATPLQQLATQFSPSVRCFHCNPTDHRLRRASSEYRKAFSVQIVASCSDCVARCNTPPRQLQQKHFSMLCCKLLTKLHSVTTP